MNLRKLAKYIFYAVMSIVVLFGFFALYLQFQPPFYFPKPTGHYTVGTKLYHWIDTARKDRKGNDLFHPYQELMVKIWYPTSSSVSMAAVSYAPDLFACLKTASYLTWLMSGAAPKIYCYETIGEPIAHDKKQYPLIIFSPGWRGRYDSNTLYCQELASHGYIVVGISHPGDSKLMQFLDGRMCFTRDLSCNKSFRQRRKIFDQEDVEERVADVRFVLDQIEALADDTTSEFYQRIDKERIGIFGQSSGGSTAVTVCRRDPRVKAGVDLDGGLFGVDAAQSFDKPFMFMLAGEKVNFFESSNLQELQKAFGVSTLEEEQMLKDRYLLGIQKLADNRAGQYLFVLNGAGHIDFTDSALLLKKSIPELVRLFIKFTEVRPENCGPIDSMRVTEIVNTYLVNFFDKYLKGQPSELLDGAGKKFVEVERKLQR